MRTTRDPSPSRIVLDDSQSEAARAALLGPHSDELIDAIFRLAMSGTVDGASDTALSLARTVGWITPGPPFRLTPLGSLVADPIREYRFWLERDKALHSESAFPFLAREHLAGKQVLELGSGFGCNLFSLSGLDGEFVGVEPLEIYRQFTPILAARERIDVPTVVAGSAEEIPFSDESFDVVLCYSSLQYMDIRTALREISRVLRPEGRLLVIGGLLPGETRRIIRKTLGARTDGLRGELLSLLNTCWYCATGRRLVVPSGAAATTAPIYPPLLMIRRWLQQAGMQIERQECGRIGFEMCVSARKPGPG